MKDGLFISLAALFLKGPTWLVITVGFVGFFAAFLSFFLIPLRVGWVVLRLAGGKTRPVSDRRYYRASMCCLALCAYAVVEFAVVTSTAGTGAAALGFIFPFWGFLTFTLYLLFEWLLGKAYEPAAGDNSPGV